MSGGLRNLQRTSWLLCCCIALTRRKDEECFLQSLASRRVPHALDEHMMVFLSLSRTAQLSSDRMGRNSVYGMGMVEMQFCP